MVRNILLCLETGLLAMFLMALPVFCAGNIAGILVSLLLLGVTYNNRWFSSLLRHLWSSAGGRAVIVGASLVIMAAAVYVSALSVLMYRALDKQPGDSRVVVVLGCQVKGTRPSLMLKRRLDAAKNLLESDSGLVCVVSGGKGTGEDISEAQCMKEYLVSCGIDEDRVIMEDRSTTTYENLKFTRDILDERGLGRDIIIATDAFHEYRASLLAKKLGYSSTSACPAFTKFRYLPTYWVREWIGLTHYFIFGN